jgi:hypothetical protein
MTRPYVSLAATNRAAELRTRLLARLPELAAIPGVLGITLNGGISRGFADALSEIDVTLFLGPGVLHAWGRDGSPVPLGISQYDGWTWDVAAFDLAAREEQPWERDARWDGSYAEILHDPTGRLQALFAAQATPPAIDAVEGELFQCWWYYRLAGDIWIGRGDWLQGHHILNQATAALVRALFAANGELIPHEKWLFHMSRTLAWRPEKWEERLTAALRTGNLDEESLRTRQAAIDALWQEIDAYVRRTQFSNLPVTMMQRSFYNLLAALVERGSFSWAEWETLGGTGLMNMDPFHPLLIIDTAGVRLDVARLATLTPAEMYSWHYAVVEAVRRANP